MAKKRILLLGSTGSIGKSTDQVIQNLDSELSLVGLAAHSSWEPLLEQVRRHRPEAVALVDQDAAGHLRAALEKEQDLPAPMIYEGEEGLVEHQRHAAVGRRRCQHAAPVWRRRPQHWHRGRG